MDTKDDPKALSTKEVIARETAQLLEQQNRISVGDLASKFEKGLAAAAKLSEEARLREAASSPEKHVLLKKLRDALEPLKGHVAGRNKDDVEEAIAMVEALAVQLTQREGELIQEKEEVKKLANFLKQASEDAKKLVDGERAFASAEIEDARAAVQRVEEALQEHERMSQASGKQDMDTPPGFFSPVIPKLEPFDASQQLLMDPPGDALNYRDMDTRRSFSSPVNPKKRRKSMTILNLLAEMDPRERVRRIRMIYNSLLASVKESWSKGAGSNLIASRLMGNFKCWRGARIIGEFPGVSVGDVFMNRIELCVVGMHHTTQDCMDYIPASMSPIGIPIATSVVISDDVADGVEIIYTGHRHVADQNLESGNLALETNMQNKITVRVIRGKKYMGSLSDKVYVYDGLYTVVKSWFEKEESGFGVYKCKLRRMEGQEATGIKSWWDTTCDFVFSGDISKGRENVAVRLFNNRDKNRDPLDFEYLARTNIPRIVKGTGCACLYACSDGCSCAEKNGGKFPYNLEGLLVRGKPLIYECGPFCSCPPRCRNRVTQKGLKNRLEVFRSQQSEETDWGVRSLDLIQAGAFICEYVGVVLTRNQAQVAGTNGDKLTDPSRFSNKWAEWGDFSLIDEQFVRPSYPPIPPLHFYLDLSSTRNVAGWIRHGASPNLFIQFVVYDHNNLMLPRLMLFAMENIPPMRELSFEV